MTINFSFSETKNSKLLKERNIEFEEIIVLIENGQVLDILDHPNQDRYPGQKIYVINVDGYCYMVPFTANGEDIFLKTIIPSRKATKTYLQRS